APNEEVWTRDKAAKERYRYTDPTTGAVEIRERWVPPSKLVNRADGVRHTVVVREKGVPHYISIYDKPLVEAVRSLGSSDIPGWLRFTGKLLRGIGKLYTTYSPNFIVRNFLRDIQTAVMTLQGENMKGLGW